jgi:hypothetical protein
MIGININCKRQDFCRLILDGAKTVETRNCKSLHPYVGKRVGIVRTGIGTATLVGHATVGKPHAYASNAHWLACFAQHRVQPDSSAYGFDSAKTKWGYPLGDVEPCEPRKITSRGIVARKI